MKMEVTRFVSMSVLVLSLTSAVTWQRINFSSAFNLLLSDADPPTYLLLLFMEYNKTYIIHCIVSG